MTNDPDGERQSTNVISEETFNTSDIEINTMQTHTDPYTQQQCIYQEQAPTPQSIASVQHTQSAAIMQQYPLGPMQQPQQVVYYPIDQMHYHQGSTTAGVATQPCFQPQAMSPTQSLQHALMPTAVPLISSHYANQMVNLPNSYTQVHPSSSTHGETWKKAINPKKRTRTSERPMAGKQTKITKYWLARDAVETQNRFERLSEESEGETENIETQKQTEKQPLIQKAPPITIYQTEKISPVQLLLDEIAPKQYTIKTVGPEEIKIQILKPELFNPVIEALKKKNTLFHTYKPKQERSYRVVMKGIHPSAEDAFLKQKLLEHGHEATNIWNIRHRVTKQPLPLHYVDLKQNDNNKDIFKLKIIGANEVRFEPPYVKRTIPQCTKCQSYGHTKNFCHKTAQCVKCAGKHTTKDCPRKEKDNNVKCVNCEGNHPANYRGCTVHKQLQQRLYPTLRNKAAVKPKKDTANQQPQSTSTSYQIPVNYNAAYPSLPTQNRMGPTNIPNNTNQQRQAWQANQTTNINQTSNQQPHNMNKLENMLGQLMTQMSTMLNLLTTLVNRLA